jgi:hypothetical protein
MYETFCVASSKESGLCEMFLCGQFNRVWVDVYTYLW